LIVKSFIGVEADSSIDLTSLQVKLVLAHLLLLKPGGVLHNDDVNTVEEECLYSEYAINAGEKGRVVGLDNVIDVIVKYTEEHLSFIVLQGFQYEPIIM